MRVLVTRPQHQAEATAARLLSRGHEPVLAPVAAIVPTEDPMPGGPFAAFLLTSANAIPALQSCRRTLGDLPVFAVGQRSAEMARAAGFGQAATVGGDAADLARLVAGTLAAGEALLHVAGRDRKPEPARSLARLGHPVTVWESYETRLLPACPDTLALALDCGRLDVALHFSRRTTAHLVALAKASGLGDALAALAHVCLSADVAAALGPAAAGRLVTAARPDEASLLEALDGAGPAGRPGSPLPQSR